MKLKSFEGLGIIPIDILAQGSQKIVRYLLDLFRSPEADPLFRSKIMVVGFAEIGKTSMLECLFPLSGSLFTREAKKKLLLMKEVEWQQCSLRLIGNNLSQGDVISEGLSQKEQREQRSFGTIYLSHKPEDGWSVARIDDHEKPGFRLQRSSEGGFVSELYCGDLQERETWFTRIDGTLRRDRTHGELPCFFRSFSIHS